MNELLKLETKEQRTAIVDALQERKITCAEFMAEIKPLLEEYFIGEFLLDKEMIKVRFLNGQEMLLTVSQ